MGITDRWGIVIAFGIQAYNIILLRNYFSSIPKELEEAAIVDGANEFQLFGKVYVPMSKAFKHDDDVSKAWGNAKNMLVTITAGYRFEF